MTEKMKAWMRSTTALKTTTLGSAIRYTLGIWGRLTLFIDDPEIWLATTGPSGARAVR